MTGRGRRDLSRDEVVGAALALLDEGGERACTVRQVAARLEVTPMAIYWHVKDKDDLLGAVLDRVLSTLATPPAGELPADPLDALAVLGRRYREAFLAHPHAAALLATRPMPDGEAAQALVGGVVALLGAAGLVGVPLVCATALLLEFAMGSVLLEHGLGRADAFAAIAQDVPLPDPATRFEFGMTTLIAGIRATTVEGHPRP